MYIEAARFSVICQLLTESVMLTGSRRCVWIVGRDLWDPNTYPAAGQWPGRFPDNSKPVLARPRGGRDTLAI